MTDQYDVVRPTPPDDSHYGLACPMIYNGPFDPLARLREDIREAEARGHRIMGWWPAPDPATIDLNAPIIIDGEPIMLDVSRAETLVQQTTPLPGGMERAAIPYDSMPRSSPLEKTAMLSEAQVRAALKDAQARWESRDPGHPWPDISGLPELKARLLLADLIGLEESNHTARGSTWWSIWAARAAHRALEPDGKPTTLDCGG